MLFLSSKSTGRSRDTCWASTVTAGVVRKPGTQRASSRREWWRECSYRFGLAGPGASRHHRGMKVVVNFDLCESNALCCFAAPEVFEVREDELLYVLDENPPESLRAKVQDAVNACPKRAISIED